MPRKNVCCYCGKTFKPSLYHPKQKACDSAECQRRRKREYRCRKLAMDAEYRQTCADSRKKWRDRHPDYTKQYRMNNEASVKRNRQLQQGRNARRKLHMIAKNTLATDIRHSFAKVWTIHHDSGVIAKNILAFPQVLILQPVAQSFSMPAS
jgi:hypothetical protein